MESESFNVMNTRERVSPKRFFFVLAGVMFFLVSSLYPKWVFFT